METTRSAVGYPPERQKLENAESTGLRGILSTRKHVNLEEARTKKGWFMRAVLFEFREAVMSKSQ